MEKKFDKITVDTKQKWYEEYQKTEETCKHSMSETDVLHLKDEGKKYLNAETAAFQMKQSRTQDSELKWLKIALQQGTTSDKVAANIVLIQDDPKHNLNRLISLISQVQGAKHNQYDMIITSLKDLFLSDLLHPKFRLLRLEEQDLDKLHIPNTTDSIIKTDSARNKLLAHWYFEDQLREQYECFVLNLSTVASDVVDTNREKAISIMTDLLINNAEQEQKLLELIVNKIGDPSSKIGSKTVFYINKLLYEHPNMKLIVLREIEKLIFRKNVAQRTQYYAICLLTQYVLNKDDNETANTLMEIYFAFFKACLKKGEPDSRMMAAILAGVKRTYPYIEINTKLLDDHIDSIYKVVHLGSFNVSLNALSLLQQVSNKNQSQANRFYSTFYRKLFDRQIGIASKRAIFLNLLYRALQADQSISRSCAFIKRILQISLYFSANMTCAILYIVSKILQERRDLKHILFEQPIPIKIEKEEEIEEEYEIEDNQSEIEDIHVIEKIKGEIEENKIVLSNVIIGPDSVASETKPDVKMEEIDIKTEMQDTKPYDPFSRNPLYAGATKGLNVEFEALAKHFHPSVALFANQIIQGKPIEYTGDPLEDLTLIRFLDRYVFKNPKKLEDKKIQRRNDPLAQRTGYTPKGIRSLPVDSEAYLNERQDRIPVDELFLYRYLKQRNEIKDHIKKEDDDNEDVESVNSEEFNDMLDHMGNNQDLDDLDIAADIIPIKKKGTKRNKDSDDDDDNDDDDNDNDDNDDDDDDDDDDYGDSDDQFEDDNDTMLKDDEDDEMQDLADIDDEDLSDMEFNDSENEDVDNKLITDLKEKFKNGKKNPKNKEKKKGKGIDNNIFVSAEKFAEMLEEQGRTKRKHGSSHTFNINDGATDKQLDWEEKRHQQLKRGSFGKKRRRSVQSSNNKQFKKFRR